MSTRTAPLLDPSFLGTWKCDPKKTKDAELAAKLMGDGAEHLKCYLNLTVTFGQEGDDYTMFSDYNGSLPNRKFQFKLGESQNISTPENGVCQVYWNMEGRSLVGYMKVPSKDRTVVITRTVEGDVMTTEYKSEGFSSYITYIRV